MERLDGDGSLDQPSFRRDDEVQVPKVHVRAQDLADIVTSHPMPDVDVETHKSSLSGVPIISVLSHHQQVNF